MIRLVQKICILLVFVSAAAVAEDAVVPAKGKPKYYLSVTAIFRDDARFLKEWIEFHRLVGVEHFYLYNNLSSDNYKEVLEPYIQENVVDLIEWSKESFDIRKWSAVQNRAYSDAVHNARGETEWLAIIDTDEFLFPVQGDDLKTVLKSYQQFGGVGVNWQMFGTSNVPRIPEGSLMIENLLLMAPPNYEDHFYVKSIVRPACVVSVPNPHYARYKDKFYSVNENKRKIGGRKSPYVSVNQLRINHYWTRDEDFFENVKLARELKFGRDPSFCIRKNNEINHAYDDTILRFAPALRERMFQEALAE